MILAGGRSRRFGKTKALASWRGRALIDCVFDVVRVVLTPPEIWVAIGRTGQDPRLFEHLRNHDDLVFVEDAPEVRGPIAGIKAGLVCAAQRNIPWVLVCGCDMPAMRFQLLAGMVELARGAPKDTSVIIPRVPGDFRTRFEPLHAIYRPERVLPMLNAAVADGKLALQALVSELPGSIVLDPEDLERLDPGWRQALANVNTPAELEGFEH